MRPILKTELTTIHLDSVARYDNFIFLLRTAPPKVSLLCRVLTKDEKIDQAPDMILKINDKIERLIFISDSFNNSASAFNYIKKNKEQAEKMLSKLKDMDKVNAVVQSNKSDIPQIITYFYLYNYYGGDTYEDKVINGAGILISFRPYKNGRLIKFIKEPSIVTKMESSLCDKPIKNTYWLPDMLNVRFTKKNFVSLQVNNVIKQLFLDHFDWDDIIIQIESYELSYWENEFLALSTGFMVSEKIFNSFLDSHKDEFDIPDNHYAQCISYGWIDEKKSLN